MNAKLKISAAAGCVLAVLCLLIGCSEDDGELIESHETSTAATSVQLSTDVAETYLSQSEATAASRTSDTEPTFETSAAPETQAEETTAAPVELNFLEFESNGNGTCKVKSAGNCTDVCIVIPERSPSGDVVTSISDKAFYGCTEIVAIQIPSSVTMIGEQAFGSCTSLVYIAVNRKNPAFCDIVGVLYSADATEIIAYPSGSSAAEYSIARSVKTIAPMAFYNCKNLRVINYGGTQEQWAGISIGAYNYSVNTASIYCIDSQK